METCLYDPEHGYYMHGTPLGREGSFVTAPMLTSLFGQTLAVWLAATWQQLGRPTPFLLVEGGPGTGTLMQDVVETLPPPCRAAAQPWLLEISPLLEKVQRKTLAGKDISWGRSLGELPPETPMIFFANEFLDAFPIRQFGPDGAERMVYENNGTLAFTLPSDNLTETHEAAETFLHTLKQRATAALFIDYGYVEGNGDTLQALHEHTAVDVLHRPGETDLTAHVPFGKMAATLGPTSTISDMAPFLLGHGFATLAATALDNTPDPNHRTAIEQASARLLAPNAMGQLFKVLSWQDSASMAP
jgi:NADH dehydrogenase [ubiquinone] 1 alpha subcomplex assembly factor 7